MSYGTRVHIKYDAIVIDKTLKKTEINMRKAKKTRERHSYRQYDYWK